MPGDPKNSNQSVGKALQIIDILSQSIAPMRLQDIAKAVGMPTSTVLRMITALAEYGYIRQDSDTMKYFLTLKFAKIGFIVSSRFSIRETAHPTLLELASQCNEAACIAIESGSNALYIDITDGPDAILKITQYIGKQSPLHCTGVGKCMLLNYSEEQIDDLISRVGLKRHTPYTLITKKSLLEELGRIRSQGYALDDQECELGVRCVAAPIRDYTGKVIAAISISGPCNRMTHEYLEALSSIIVKAAQSISSRLSFD